MAGLPCRIVLRGEVNARFQQAFAGLRLRHRGGRTELSGELVDWSELQGLLDQLFDLGMQVITVQTGEDARCHQDPDPGSGADDRPGGQSPG
jgi:hypothetical protein